MATWEIESDLRLRPRTDGGKAAVPLDDFALRCYGVLGNEGAADVILTADPSRPAVHASFILNSVSKPEHAHTNALRLLAAVTERLDDQAWKVEASEVTVTRAD